MVDAVLIEETTIKAASSTGRRDFTKSSHRLEQSKFWFSPALTLTEFAEIYWLLAETKTTHTPLLIFESYIQIRNFDLRVFGRRYAQGLLRIWSLATLVPIRTDAVTKPSFAH